MSYACKVERSSIADYLPDFARLGQETAFAEPNGYRVVRSTYRDVADAAYRFARELTARKIRKGDRVVLWGPNSAAWVSAFFGCAHRGVIVVPMDYAASPDFVQRVFQQVNARLILCSSDRALPDLPAILFEDLQESLAPHSAAAFAPENVTREDALEIVFTSGTTAEPKGVVITHGNVLANIAPLEEQIKRYLKYERWVHPVRFLNLLPLSHVFGQFLGMYLPPLMAGTVVFQETLKPAEVIKTIRRERVSVLVAVPRMLQSLKEKIERDSGTTQANSRPSERNSHPRRANNSSAAGGFSAASIANSDGNSGPSSPAAPPSTASPKNSGDASVSPSFKDTA